MNNIEKLKAIKELLKEDVLEMLPVTFGMEVEYNRFKRSYKPMHKMFQWCEQHTDENDTILEKGISISSNLSQFIRRTSLVGEWHVITDMSMSEQEVYQTHFEGEWDDESESNHLHIGFEGCRNVTIGEASIALLFGSAFLRGESHRSIVVGEGRHSYVQPSTGVSSEALSRDSKTYWVTYNSLGTVEYRINGNPNPALISVIMGAYFSNPNLSLDISDISILDTTIRPDILERRLLSNPKNIITKNKLINNALTVYEDNPTAIHIIKKYLEGKNSYGVHFFINSHLKEYSALYNSMHTKLMRGR